MSEAVWHFIPAGSDYEQFTSKRFRNDRIDYGVMNRETGGLMFVNEDRRQAVDWLVDLRERGYDVLLVSQKTAVIGEQLFGLWHEVGDDS